MRVFLVFAMVLTCYNSLGQDNTDLLNVKAKLDTIFDDSYYKRGSYIVGPFKKKKDIAGNSFGFWQEFYSSGKLKGQGYIAKGNYTQCCTVGPCQQSYMYKIGEWKYYYENGKIKAKGNYKTQVYNYPTSCEGGDDIVIQKVGKRWKYFDEKGQEIKITDKRRRELEEFYASDRRYSFNYKY